MQSSKLKILSLAFSLSLGFLLLAIFGVRAEVAPAVSFCAGNLCQSGAIVLSGCVGKTSTLHYEYTQHARPGGDFKVRFWNDASVSSACPLSYAVISDAFGTLFDGLDKGYVVKPGTSFSGTETVTSVAYKVEDGNGFNGDVDIVLELGVKSGASTGQYEVRFAAVENGQSFISPNTPVYIDAAAPSNANEKKSFAGWAACADGIDNDLNYRRDCADVNCLDEIGNTTCVVDDQCKCEAWETTCFDRFDNDFDPDGEAGGYTDTGGDYDLETGADCRDFDCDGKQGDNDEANQKCYFQNEHTGFTSSNSCGDNFNNDADDGNDVFAPLSLAYAVGFGQSGYRDCFDNNCWRKGTLDGDRCPSKEKTADWNLCLDGGDNDFDDGLNGKDSGVSGALDGGDCLDYDCAGVAFYNAGACAVVAEVQDFINTENALSLKNCFDGVDNDLDAYIWNGAQYVVNSDTDAGIDCSDADCVGVENPDAPYNTCVSSEFVLYSHNFCANPPGYLVTLTGGIDDDGDGPANCSDNDCRRQFDNCGVCPAQEFWKYDACADGLDNDFDDNGAKDCADTDCEGKLGQLNGGAQCGAENNEAACADGFDNDADGAVDCADAGCAGHGTCQALESRCADGFDNDANGEIDCLDTQCEGECAAAFSIVSCQPDSVWDPEYPPGALFVSGGTVRGAQTRRLYQGDPGDNHQIRLVGSATYSSVTATIGNANNDAQYFPYDSRSCALTSSDETNFTLIADADGNVLQLINKPVGNINAFDVIISCPLPDGEIAGTVHNYPVVIDVERAGVGGGELESGELFWTTALYENIKPTIAEIEVAGVLSTTGEVKIPYGGTLQARAVPAGDEAVCGCDFWMGSTETCDTASDVTCQKPSSSTCRLHAANQIYDVPEYFLRASAEDGSGNQGNYGPVPARQINLNITPIVKAGTRVSFDKPSPFYAPGDSVGWSGAHFQGPAGTIFGDCALSLDGSPAAGMVIKENAGASEITCRGNFSAPASRGEYRITVTVSDQQNDTVATPGAVFYVCPGGDTAPPCDKADFDGDGSPERTFTDMYGALPLTCDNCPPGLLDADGSPLPSYNPDQEDANANGIGDLCEQDLIAEKKVCKGTQDLCVSDEDCPEIEGATGSCVEGKICQNNPWQACVTEENCGGSPEQCVSNTLGLCGGNGKLCWSDNDCTPGEQCLKILPWLETRAGDIYASGSIRASAPPPVGKFNATFCVLAKGAIENVTSGSVCLRHDVGEIKNIRMADKSLVSVSQGVLGRVDIKGLKAGKYGDVVSHGPLLDGGTIVIDEGMFTGALDGKVHLFQGDAEVDSVVGVKFGNGSEGTRGNGLILIEGNLTVKANMLYTTPLDTGTRELASVGIIVVKDANGNGGNISIKGTVTKIVGAWLAEGNISTGVSNEVLQVSGLMAAQTFEFGRVSASQQEGSEIITYDGRAVMNPPPGMGDVVKSLPIVTKAVPR
ncbi:MAG: hypothetical protein AAB444_02070 [Patescibacteria group bacterium]